jgi:enoyl-CoA hydratase/carnithine racemase
MPGTGSQSDDPERELSPMTQDGRRNGDARHAVSLERRGAIALVRFHNQVTGDMDRWTGPALEDVIAEIEDDPDLRVTILTGATQGVFIRHYDVAELLQTGLALSARGLHFSADRPVPATALHRALDRLSQSAKPSIAALNGTAMGGGFEVALACDLRIAQAGPYRIGLPEIHAGLMPGAGGTQRLSRLLGPAAALDLLLSGGVYSPHDALRLGLVNRCADDALACALSMARDLCMRPAAALGHIKRLVTLAHEAPPERGAAAERTLFCDLLVNTESQAAMQAVVLGPESLEALACRTSEDPSGTGGEAGG